ncbi:MAG: hypothetical protein J0M08_00935 [Bacteroidetes bacterium]|nr:hypothetical protein [Bacteroidota bacterium]
MNTVRVASIEKEQLATLHFPSQEVLDSKEAKDQRLKDLERALTLGNLDHIKIKLIFADNEGDKQVETTVWGITDKRVILKQGLLIPIHRVKEVRII